MLKDKPPLSLVPLVVGKPRPVPPRVHSLVTRWVAVRRPKVSGWTRVAPDGVPPEGRVDVRRRSPRRPLGSSTTTGGTLLLRPLDSDSSSDTRGPVHDKGRLREGDAVREEGLTGRGLRLSLGSETLMKKRIFFVLFCILNKD